MTTAKNEVFIPGGGGMASSHLIFSLFIRMIEIEPATSAKTQ